jgi:carboxypeptidase family protein
MSKRLFLVATVCALLLPTAAFAQQAPAPPDHGHVVGAVVSTGTGPLIAADVTLRNAADSTVARVATAPDGRFLIDNVAFGNYSLRVDFVGYRARVFEGIVVSKASPLADLGAITLDAAMIAQQESARLK